MTTGTLARICKTGLLSYFVVISYIAMTSSMSVDLTELRNKVSKIKVIPRGNLWATGHFMGKKSVVDSSFLESPFFTERNAESLRELILQVLKIALQTRQKQLGFGAQETGFLMKLLRDDNI